MADNGVFLGLTIVRLATATFHESPFLVKSPCCKVRLSNFEENPGCASNSGQAKKFSQQTAP
jgi:hypothetical protein